MGHKAGFVNILGRPNAGKSTLLNALIGEKLAIISPKVQTTRHRILAILNKPDYQIVFSDTPGIITPKYKLQVSMMDAVHSALEDADLVLFMMDATDQVEKVLGVLEGLSFKVPKILVINKVDLISPEQFQEIKSRFQGSEWKAVCGISALNGDGLETLLQAIEAHLPESPSYYPEDVLTDRPVKFFVSELIREKLYALFRDEIPYQTAIVIREYKDKKTLTKISADIVVQRESQKAIILGAKGESIKKLGTLAREDIEAFIDNKVFLELHVKVRNNWREKPHFLKEYGY